MTNEEFEMGYSGYIRRGQIPNRISIDERPTIEASKGRFGDWGADTIIGARHKEAFLADHLGRRAKNPLDQQNSATAMRSVPPRGSGWVC